MLPLDVQNARIMTYGYNSTVAFSKSIAGIEDFARDLLERLKTTREACHAVNRPVIFVCHSMGGLVVKKALILAHDRSSHYGSLLDSISGIVFLATPHRGSGFAAPAEFASRLLRAGQLGSGTNTELVSSLRRDAEILWELSTQFVERAASLHIRTFYETEPMPFMSFLIVDKNSAVLHHPNEIAVPMGANHRTICQFHSRDCQNYVLVREAIQDLFKKALSKGQTAGTKCNLNLSVIQQFHKSDYEGYKAAIQPPVQDTCVWFLSECNYLKWLQSSTSDLLWVSGDPGCGKTTLARFLIDNVKNNLSRRGMEATTCYFFFDEKIKDQSDGASLLLALIHQLLRVDPELVVLAEKHLTLKNSQHAMGFHNLWEIFKSVLSEKKARNIVCIIDALDECEIASVSKVVRSLSSYISDQNQDLTAEAWFKVVVTSRRYQSIDDTFRTVPHFRCSLGDYAEQTDHDIETFIKIRSARMQDVTFCSDSMRSTIETRLREQCGRTFLWVSLVLDILESDTNSSSEAFDKVFADLPEELDGVYERILQRSTQPEILLQILSILAASRRALTLPEINSALAVRLGDTSQKEVERRHQFDISRRLYGVCGPFIRISNDTASFIHQTAKEFLVRPPAIPPPVGYRWKYKHCLELSEVNYRLAEICMVFLSVSDIESSPLLDSNMDLDAVKDDKSSINGGNTTNTQREGNLFDYAAKHWGAHCRLGNVLEHDKLFAKAQSLCDTSTRAFCRWFRLYWNTISTISQVPDGLTSLMMASHFGLHNMARALLDTGASVNTQDSEGWAATHWAVWNGQGDIVDETTMRLLLQPGVDLDLKDGRGLSALHWAAADGQHGVVKLLLEAGAQVDILCHDGLTPLALAVENEFLDIVELLLAYGADVNAAREHGDSVTFEEAERLYSDEEMDIDDK